MNIRLIISWKLRLVAAFILLQTLFFKFSAAEESVFIFSSLGVEPWGRIGSGIVELIAGLALLWNRSVWFGALLAAGTMAGAIASHLFILGISILGDGGQLFAYACITFIAAGFLLIEQFPQTLKSYFRS
jgi:uncharacterized membrane protein YphA (DoxX/SURF4 family)